MFSMSISTEIYCKYNSASQMQMRKTHIQHQASLLESVKTFFSPRKYYFHALTMQKLISHLTYIHFLSEKKNRSNIQEEWQNGLQGHGRNTVFVQASLCKAQLYCQLRWFDAFLRVNEHEECIQYTYKTYRLWSFCFTVWKLQDIHIMANRLLHVSKNSIWIAHSLPEYENFINCDQSTEVKDNCLYQFISEHKNMHTHTHTHKRDRQR